MGSNAFKRAIAAILSSVVSPLLQQVEINKLGEYKSCGHGRGKTCGVRAKAYAKMRHQGNRSVEGKQEIARRLRTSAVPVLRREWYAIAPDAILDEALAFTASTRRGVVKLARYYGFTAKAPVLARSLLEVANG